ncbi:MAG: DUF3617 domain-containing protein [Pseudomonadota bacterium]|nr:DUF3617 domain-containing protein [Pseudomonadota bacterium]
MRAIILVTALAFLAGCNRSPSVEAHNASVAEVTNKIAAAGGPESFVRPGKWQTSVAIDSMDAPGMPSQTAETMKSMSARTQAVQSCVTPEQAKKPTPEMFSGDSGRCRYDQFNIGRGKIDMVMRCTGEGPGAKVAQKMTMTGTYDPDSYHMAMVSSTDTGTTGMGSMTMKMHLDAKRLGDCDMKK